MKICILLTYFNRPLWLERSLLSILESDQHHQDWELAIWDDGSKIPCRPIVDRVLKDHLSQVAVLESGISIDDKIAFGLQIGKAANAHLQSIDADVAIIMGDDDVLVPTYLRDLSQFLVSNKNVLYCYSDVFAYNPIFQKTSDVHSIAAKYHFSGPINPVNNLDATQVAWRLCCNHEYGAWFVETTKISDKPWLKDTDKSFFEQLFEKCGLCHPTGLVGQYKGIHEYQLMWHKNATEQKLRDYDKMYTDLAGRLF